jgi:hypothetical protein
MNSESHNFDIIGLTEIVHKDINYIIGGYHPIVARTRPNSEIGKRGVKFAIFRDDLTVFISHTYESLFIEVQTSNQCSIIVGVIYRPKTPPLADINIFTDKLITTIDTIQPEHKNCSYLGTLTLTS